MMSSFFTSILTAACLVRGISAGDIWAEASDKGMYQGGWSQNPAEMVTAIVTRTQTVCPCATTGASGHPTNVFTRTTSSTPTTNLSSSITSGTGSSYTTNSASSTVSGTTTSSSVTTGSTNSASTTSSSGTTSSNPSSTISGTTSASSGSSSSTSATTSGGTSGTSSGTSSGTTSASTSGVTSTNSTTTSSSTTSSGSAIPTFNFLAFGNPYIVDGTSLGDYFVVASQYPDQGYANFNDANTGFYVDSAGALTDGQTGGKAIVIRGLNPAPVRFFTQSYIDDPSNPDAGNIEICTCALDASQNLSCDCNGLTAFAADYRGYLYMQSAAASATSAAATTITPTPTAKKRNVLEARQSASDTTAPVAVSLSATPAPTTTASTTTTTCNAPLQTFNLVSNGSVVTNGSASNVQPVPDGKYVFQTDWNATEHYEYAGFLNSSLSNPDPGFYGGNFTWDPCSGIVTETTYGHLLTTAPSSTFSEAYFMPLDIIISAGGDICYCNIDQTTFAFTCTCGPNSIFQNPPSWQLYIGSYARVGGGVVYPIAQIIG